MSAPGESDDPSDAAFCDGHDLGHPCALLGDDCSDARFDATPRTGTPALTDPRDTQGHRRFWLLCLLARGVRIGDAGEWLVGQYPERGRA